MTNLENEQLSKRVTVDLYCSSSNSPDSPRSAAQTQRDDTSSPIGF